MGRLAMAAALLGAALVGTVRPAVASVEDAAMSDGGGASLQAPVMPEPLALLMLGSALAGVSGLMRRREGDTQVPGGSGR